MTPELREAIRNAIVQGSTYDEAALLNGVAPGVVSACIDCHERGVGSDSDREAGRAFSVARAQSVRDLRRKAMTLAEDTADVKALVAASAIVEEYTPVALGILVVTPASESERELARARYLAELDVAEGDDLDDVDDFDEEEYEKSWDEDS